MQYKSLTVRSPCCSREESRARLVNTCTPCYDMHMQRALTGELLKAVSRSFYLTISHLPAEMREGIAVAYLLARATDSVADAASASVSRRAELLRCMAAAIAGLGEAAELVADLRRLPVPENPSEAELLSRFDEALAALRALPDAQQALVRTVLATITEGQLWDLSFFEEHTCVLSDEQTRRYTYRVAGCVGKFWTQLGLATMGERFCDPATEEDMVEAGQRYGCGLQLVNILRDREEDARRGRSYLCSDAAAWADRAERYLRDGLDYSRRLRTFRLRFACMLPALLGLKTLAALRRARLGKRVKIPRRAVYASALRAFFAAL